MYGGRDPDLWERLSASVKAALIMFVLILLLSLVNAYALGASLIFVYPVVALIYVGNGALAAHFAEEEAALHYASRPDLPQAGAGAGVVLSILFWVLNGILIFLLGLTAVGVGWAGYLACAICGPVDLVVAVLLGGLGAWLFQKFSLGEE